MGRIFLGLLITIAGALITIKADVVYRAVGPIPTAEKFLGTEGGSRLAYKLIGIILAILGFMIMTNLISGVLEWLVQSLFGGLVN